MRLCGSISFLPNPLPLPLLESLSFSPLFGGDVPLRGSGRLLSLAAHSLVPLFCDPCSAQSPPPLCLSFCISVSHTITRPPFTCFFFLSLLLPPPPYHFCPQPLTWGACCTSLFPLCCVFFSQQCCRVTPHVPSLKKCGRVFFFFFFGGGGGGISGSESENVCPPVCVPLACLFLFPGSPPWCGPPHAASPLGRTVPQDGVPRPQPFPTPSLIFSCLSTTSLCPVPSHP